MRKEKAMGCRWCVHWVTEDKYANDFGQTGECRRYPRPEETVSEYRCGEFVCEPDHYGEARGANMMHGFWQRMHKYGDEAKTERDKRIALEKELKALRKQMKTPNAALTRRP
jgi:hypothetical protein